MPQATTFTKTWVEDGVGTGMVLYTNGCLADSSSMAYMVEGRSIAILYKHLVLLKFNDCFPSAQKPLSLCLKVYQITLTISPINMAAEMQLRSLN
jgi:hypothetical protein